MAVVIISRVSSSSFTADRLITLWEDDRPFAGTCSTVGGPILYGSVQKESMLCICSPAVFHPLYQRISTLCPALCEPFSCVSCDMERVCRGNIFLPASGVDTTVRAPCSGAFRHGQSFTEVTFSRRVVVKACPTVSCVQVSRICWAQKPTTSSQRMVCSFVNSACWFPAALTAFHYFFGPLGIADFLVSRGDQAGLQYRTCWSKPVMSTSPSRQPENAKRPRQTLVVV